MHSKLLQQVESLKLEVHLCIGENFKSEAQGIEGLKHAVKVVLDSRNGISQACARQQEELQQKNMEIENARLMACEAQRRLTESSEELQRCSQQLAKTTSELEDAHQMSRESQIVLLAMQQELAAVKSDFAQAILALNEAKNLVAAGQENITELHLQINIQRQRFSRVALEAQSLQNELECMVEGHEMVRSLEREIGQMASELTRKKADVENMYSFTGDLEKLQEAMEEDLIRIMGYMQQAQAQVVNEQQQKLGELMDLQVGLTTLNVANTKLKEQMGQRTEALEHEMAGLRIEIMTKNEAQSNEEQKTESMALQLLSSEELFYEQSEVMELLRQEKEQLCAASLQSQEIIDRLNQDCTRETAANKALESEKQELVHKLEVIAAESKKQTAANKLREREMDELASKIEMLTDKLENAVVAHTALEGERLEQHSKASALRKALDTENEQLTLIVVQLRLETDTALSALEELSHENSKCMQELTTRSQELVDKQGQIAGLNGKLHSTEQELCETKDDLATRSQVVVDSQSKVAQLTELNAQLEGQIAGLNGKLHSTEQELCETKDDLATRSQVVVDSQSKVAQLTELNAQLEGQIAGLNGKLHSTEQDLQVAKTELENSILKLHVKETELAGLHAELIALQQMQSRDVDRENLKQLPKQHDDEEVQEIVAAQIVAAEHRLMFDRTRAELENLKVLHEKVQNEFKELQTQHQFTSRHAGHQLQALEMRVDELSGQADVAQSELTMLQKLKDAADDRIHMLELSFDELRGQSEVTNEEMRSVAAQRDAAQQELTERLECCEEMTCKMEKLNQQLKVADTERDLQAMLCDQLRKEMMHVSAAEEEKSNRLLAELQKDRNALATVKESLEESCEKLRRDLASAIMMASARAQEVEALKLNLDQASARLAHMNEEQKELNQKLHMADDDVHHRLSQADFLEQTLQATSKQLAVKDLQVTLLNDALLKCTNQNESLSLSVAALLQKLSVASPHVCDDHRSPSHPDFFGSDGVCDNTSTEENYKMSLERAQRTIDALDQTVGELIVEIMDLLISVSAFYNKHVNEQDDIVSALRNLLTRMSLECNQLILSRGAEPQEAETHVVDETPKAKRLQILIGPDGAIILSCRCDQGNKFGLKNFVHF